MPFAGWTSSAAMPDLGPYLRREQCRERIIDAALPMCAASGYESTTTKQPVAAAGLAPDRFEDYIRSKDAVVLALLSTTCCRCGAPTIDSASTVAVSSACSGLISALATAFFHVTGRFSEV